MPFTLPLTALNRNDLPRAGGKGANLGEMLRAGLPVPPGFCVLTDAYRAFVAANHLETEIMTVCAAVDPTIPAALEAASAAIRARFESGVMPADISAEILAAHHELLQEFEGFFAVGEKSL